MTEGTDDPARQPDVVAYERALERYVTGSRDVEVLAASDVVDHLVAHDFGPEDITALHHAAFERVLARHGRWSTRDLVVRGQRFLLALMVHYARTLHEQREGAIAEADAHARAEVEKSALLASIAHELGTPITVARGFAQRARRAIEGDDPPGAIASLDEALTALDRLVALNHGLREASRHGVPLDLQPADHAIGALLMATIAWARLIADDRGLEFVTEIATPDAVARCDSGAVEVIANNLVSNAVEYSDAGGRVVLRQRVEGDLAVIEVSDRGIGMTPEVQAHVFDRFYRGGEAKRRSAQGLGLGLSTARWLARAQGGEITFVSAPGEGSTFRLTLPLATPDAGGSGAAPPGGDAGSDRRRDE